MLRALVVASGVAAVLGSADAGTALRGGRVAAEDQQHRHHHHHHRTRHHSEQHHGRHHHGKRHHADQRTVAAESVRFKQPKTAHAAPHHLHSMHHRAGRKASLNAFYAAHTAASLLEVASTAGTGDPMLGANSGGAPQQASAGDPDLSALAQLTKAAGTIEMRFKKAESDKQFGEGLDKKLVGSVEKDSETFWEDVKGLTPADTTGLSDEDAQDLQKVVQQVAQMDDDMDDPQRTSKVAGEYDTIRAELQDVDV